MGMAYDNFYIINNQKNEGPDIYVSCKNFSSSVPLNASLALDWVANGCSLLASDGTLIVTFGLDSSYSQIQLNSVPFGGYTISLSAGGDDPEYLYINHNSTGYSN